MNDEINYKTNPLHGVSLKTVVTELVDHYGFEILYAYLNINCFNMNPSIESSIKFLKKTTWAREKVEAFYMYEFKNLPSPSAEQAQLPPRDRVVPEDQVPGEPKELSVEDAAERRGKFAYKQNPPSRGERERQDNRNAPRERDSGSPWGSARKSPDSSETSSKKKVSPWDTAKPRSKR